LHLLHLFPAMTSSVDHSRDSGQGDRFFRFINGLVAEHQALQVHIDRLNLEKAELHSRLQRENGATPELYLSQQPQAQHHVLDSTTQHGVFERPQDQDTTSLKSSSAASDPNPPLPPPVHLSQGSLALKSGMRKETHDSRFNRLTEPRKVPTGELLQPVPSPNCASHSDSTGSTSPSKGPLHKLDTHFAAPKAMENAGAEDDFMADDIVREGTLMSTAVCSYQTKSNTSDSHKGLESLADSAPQVVITSRVVAMNRLRARLGHLHGDGLVTPRVLLHAIRSLGLTKYSHDDVCVLMMALKKVVTLSPAKQMEDKPSNPKALKHMGLSSVMTKVYEHSVQHRGVGCDHAARQSGQSTPGSIWPFYMAGGNPDAAYPYTFGLAFDEFAAFVIDEAPASSLEQESRHVLLTMREVLLAAEANRLVAELTHVRIDDLASPPPPPEFLSHLEPWVNLAIFINGILVGIQTDMYDHEWKGWMPIEIGFTTFFVLELLIRLKVVGIRKHFFGPDWGWNYFDVGIIAISLVNLFMELLSANSKSGPGLTVLRLVRLTRLSRMLRMLRFSYLKELALMIKGLLGGFKTLVWACVLLIFAIYLIAVFVTAIVGPDKSMKKNKPETWKMFNSVLQSMFTSFRCFTGDCTDEAGNSLVLILTDRLGWVFSVGFVVCSMMITFGIFNLIIAIYIENTLEAAKLVTQMDKKTRDRESLRVAHLTKRLLKKFCRAATHLSEDIVRIQDAGKLKQVLSNQHIDDDDEVDDFDMTISKDLFLLVIQDPSVQRLFDELEIPADRAQLFDVLDADGSGGIQVTELVQGLLKVRGDPRKSDIVATLLSVRAVQDMLRRVEEKILIHEKKILDHEEQILTHEKKVSRMVSNGMLVPIATDRRLENDCKLLS